MKVVHEHDNSARPCSHARARDTLEDMRKNRASLKTGHSQRILSHKPSSPTATKLAMLHENETCETDRIREILDTMKSRIENFSKIQIRISSPASTKQLLAATNSTTAINCISSNSEIDPEIYSEEGESNCYDDYYYHSDDDWTSSGSSSRSEVTYSYIEDSMYGKSSPAFTKQSLAATESTAELSWDSSNSEIDPEICSEEGATNIYDDCCYHSNDDSTLGGFSSRSEITFSYSEDSSYGMSSPACTKPALTAAESTAALSWISSDSEIKSEIYSEEGASNSYDNYCYHSQDDLTSGGSSSRNEVTRSYSKDATYESTIVRSAFSHEQCVSDVDRCQEHNYPGEPDSYLKKASVVEPNKCAGSKDHSDVGAQPVPRRKVCVFYSAGHQQELSVSNDLDRLLLDSEVILLLLPSGMR